MSSRIARSRSRERRVASRRTRAARDGLSSFRGPADGPGIEKTRPVVPQLPRVAPELSQLRPRLRDRGQVVDRVLQAAQFPPHPSGEPAALRAPGHAAGDRAHGRDGAAGDEHHLQVERAGQRDQARHPEIDGSVLDPGDVALRYAGIDAQLALAEPSAFAGPAQGLGYGVDRIGHSYVEYYIYSSIRCGILYFCGNTAPGRRHCRSRAARARRGRPGATRGRRPGRSDGGYNGFQIWLNTRAPGGAEAATGVGSPAAPPAAGRPFLRRPSAPSCGDGP